MTDTARRARRPQLHGTLAGVARHVRDGTEPCARCARADRTHPFVHGKRSGYERHLREGTLACDPCLIAHREYHQGYRDGIRLRAVPV